MHDTRTPASLFAGSLVDCLPPGRDEELRWGAVCCDRQGFCMLSFDRGLVSRGTILHDTRCYGVELCSNIGACNQLLWAFDLGGSREGSTNCSATQNAYFKVQCAHIQSGVLLSYASCTSSYKNS